MGLDAPRLGQLGQDGIVAHSSSCLQCLRLVIPGKYARPPVSAVHQVLDSSHRRASIGLLRHSPPKHKLLCREYFSLQMFGSFLTAWIPRRRAC